MPETVSLRCQALPRELTDPKSDSQLLIAAVADIPVGHHNRPVIAARLRDVLHMQCGRSRASRVDGVLCRSSEDSGQAFPGALCGGCPVSRPAPIMVFLGQITLAQEGRTFICSSIRHRILSYELLEAAPSGPVLVPDVTNLDVTEAAAA
jgi:hypothetical protein